MRVNGIEKNIDSAKRMITEALGCLEEAIHLSDVLEAEYEYIEDKNEELKERIEELEKLNKIEE